MRKTKPTGSPQAASDKRRQVTGQMIDLNEAVAALSEVLRQARDTEKCEREAVIVALASLTWMHGVGEAVYNYLSETKF